ncbi:hypothetical protein AWV82_13935 [Listeria monocytogenes]|nr:hypothetical protein [Listeria monocytogenes]EAH3957177.1 hypothetical protein [Listeria monocytogenes]
MGFSIRMRKRIRGRLGLKGSKFIRKSRRYDSYKGIIGQVAKNRIHWRFYTSIPHQKENFFGLLKKAMYYGAIYTNFEQWNQAINEWIHYYNHRRLKTKLGCSPIQHRERMTA